MLIKRIKPNLIGWQARDMQREPMVSDIDWNSDQTRWQIAAFVNAVLHDQPLPDAGKALAAELARRWLVDDLPLRKRGPKRNRSAAVIAAEEVHMRWSVHEFQDKGLSKTLAVSRAAAEHGVSQRKIWSLIKRKPGA